MKELIKRIMIFIFGPEYKVGDVIIYKSEYPSLSMRGARLLIMGTITKVIEGETFTMYSVEEFQAGEEKVKPLSELVFDKRIVGVLWSVNDAYFRKEVAV